MAARKPAITGVARPQGFIDDAAKGIGKAIKKGLSKTKNKLEKRPKKYSPPKYRGRY